MPGQNYSFYLVVRLKQYDTKYRVLLQRLGLKKHALIFFDALFATTHKHFSKGTLLFVPLKMQISLQLSNYVRRSSTRAITPS